MANCNDCICSEVCYYKSFNDVRNLKKRRNDVEKICKSFVHRDSLKTELIRKGCEYCTGVVKTFPTHCDGEAYITKLTPLPAIDLMTGKMAEAADPSFFAIRIQSDDMGEDFVPIRFCPKCGRELKEV